MQTTRINVYAQNRGWLFEDLKQHFYQLNGHNNSIVTVSDQPESSADAWVAIRTREGHASPNLEHTVVCLHDLFSEPGMYQPGGSRQSVRSAAGLVLSHPAQRAILTQAGMSFDQTRIIERPLGALKIFQPR